MRTGLKRWCTVLLTMAVGVGAPVSALAKDGPAPNADCQAVEAVAGAHQSWLNAFPVLAARLDACNGRAPAAGGPAPGDDEFDDLQGYDWAAPDITLLAQLGVIQGEGHGRFAPEGAMTRAQFAALLQRLFQLPQPATPVSFTDVQPGFWGYSAIEAAAPYMTEFNTPGGVAFEPSLPVVRIEVAATIGEIEIAEKNASLPSAGQAAQLWAQFSDGNLVPSGIAQAAAISLQLGLMQGFPDGTFGVEDTLTRAQAAVLLARVLRGSETIGTGTTPPAGQSGAPTVSGIAPSNGPAAGGTAVVVSGSGFTQGATVLFGAAPATSVTYVSASTLDAVAPAGTGTVNVLVTESTGTSAATAADMFTYAQAGPAVSAIAPTNGPAAGGTAVVISGSGFTPDARVLFGATPAASVTYVNASTLDAVAPAGTGTVDVEVVQPSGTSAATKADEFTYAQAQPELTITTVSPASGPTAGGTPVLISGTGFASGAQVYFGAAAATNVVVYNGTTMTATSPAGAGTVAVTVVQGGVTASSSGAVFSYTCNGTVSDQTYCASD